MGTYLDIHTGYIREVYISLYYISIVYIRFCYIRVVYIRDGGYIAARVTIAVPA